MKKIVIIGPESTGKSTLCEQLADQYKTSRVAEYAREHLLKEGTNYTYDDLLFIAKRQLQMEDEYAKNTDSNLLFIDTDMYMMKVWCEFVFGKCHKWILDRIAERHYDMYLLCSPDLPWVKDELREYPDLESRLKLFHTYRDLMINQPVPWNEIKGTSSDRLASAIRAVNNLLK